MFISYINQAVLSTARLKKKSAKLELMDSATSSAAGSKKSSLYVNLSEDTVSSYWEEKKLCSREDFVKNDSMLIGPFAPNEFFEDIRIEWEHLKKLPDSLLSRNRSKQEKTANSIYHDKINKSFQKTKPADYPPVSVESWLSVAGKVPSEDHQGWKKQSRCNYNTIDQPIDQIILQAGHLRTLAKVGAINKASYLVFSF